MKPSELHRHWRSLPLVDLGTVTRGGTPLVLAPHPDDESLGCGGMIAASCADGAAPVVVILTDGSGSHPNSRTHPPAALRELRESEARTATAVLGLPPERLVFLRVKDGAAPRGGAEFDVAVGKLVLFIELHRCSVVLAPWMHDPHRDHEAAHMMAVAAAWRTGVRRMSYPVWGWTLGDEDDTPAALDTGVRLDIAPHLPAKRAAIAAHASQHGKVVTDDPTGFRLPAELLAACDAPHEVFLGAME